jgi:hypothetical protein
MDYVISANLRRRHWSKEKKATVYAKLCGLQQGGKAGVTYEMQSNVSNDTLTDRNKAAELLSNTTRQIHPWIM